MAIFSRRAIQQWLEANLHVVGREATQRQIERLNDHRNPSNVIPAVWEVAMIYALCQLGEVQHEDHPGQGPKKPDVFFRSKDGGLEFLADVVAVSDAGLHDQNRISELQEGLFRLMCKHKIGHLGIRTEVGSISKGTYRDTVVRVALPPKQELESFLRKHFTPFVRQIAADPKAPHTHSIQQEGIEISASYNPKDARFSGGNYPCYTTTYSLTNNPVFKRLEEKRRQLKGSGFGGICGIILCDAGCDLLHQSGYTGPGGYSLEQVVSRFLKQTDSVQFVLAVGHHDHHAAWWSGNKTSHELIAGLFLGEALAARKAELQFLLEVPRLLPSPVQTATNAFPKRIQGGNRKPYPSQEYRMSGNKVAIDAGDVIGLLSGFLKQEDWLHEPIFQPEPMPFDQIPKRDFRPAHQFRVMQEEGRRLVAIRVLERDNNDHDLIEFEFSEVDPGKGHFQMPSDGA